MTPNASGSSPEDSPSAARQQFDELFTLVYDELRRLASVVRRGDGSATPTLTPTVLVSEAWLKLAPSPSLAQTSRVHFKRLAARKKAVVRYRGGISRAAASGQRIVDSHVHRVVAGDARCVHDEHRRQGR
jgi:hypothetical protein